MNSSSKLLAAIALVFSGVVAFGAAPPPPATPTDNTVDVLQGQKVADPYRWLENWNDPKVQAWSESQNKRTSAGTPRAC